MTTPNRIIDANANRVREALRVLEEAARFIINDPALSLELKSMRHDFTQALANTTDLIYHRDTPGDVGTSHSTPSEHARAGTADVIAAAGSRLAEALRVIEEYSKIADLQPGLDTLAPTAERLRYQSYVVTQRLMTAMGSGKARQWRLCLLLTRSLCTHHAWQEVLEQALTGGVDLVQVREKQIADSQLLEHAKAVCDIARGRAQVIINDRPDIALLAGAHGVHLGQDDLSPLQVRRLAGTRLIIGVSTANLDQARQAKLQGADYCGVGPMFPTTTKHKPVIAGPDYLREYVAWGGLAHLAIGGVTPDNIHELVEAGCKGVAVSAAVCGASDPEAAASVIAQALAAAAAR